MRTCMTVKIALATLAAIVSLPESEASARWRCCRVRFVDACYAPPPCPGGFYGAFYDGGFYGGQPAYVYGAPSYAAPAPAYASPERTRAARVPQQMRVGAYDNYFEPETITVAPGTTVHWTNYGRHAHTVTSDDGRWDSGDIRPGGSYSQTFERPGAYYYYCRHHTRERMEGTIVVEDGHGQHGGLQPTPSGARNGGARSSGY